MSEDPVPKDVSVSDLTRVFARIGCLSFGGPAAQIGLMHRELVDGKGWISEDRFLSALSFCMFLPGPEAMQMATYAGWRIRGTLGGLIAGGLFVLPGAIVVLCLAVAYGAWGTTPGVSAAFLGVKATVIAIVLQALVRIAGKAVTGPVAWLIVSAAFAGLAIFAVPYPVVIALAALMGAMFLKPSAPSAQTEFQTNQTTLSQTAKTVLIWGILWLAPVALALALTPDGLLAEIGVFFSKLAVLTFGGAYAVLAWLAQEAVVARDWLNAGQMVDALGLAETTPGPLILVTEFVAALAGYQMGGLALAVTAAGMGLWVTFMPCFLWIFAAAPWIDRIMAQPYLVAALAGITAAVVGVIAQLALWFGVQVLFTQTHVIDWGVIQILVPDFASLSVTALGLTALACVVLWRGVLGVPTTLIGMAGLALVLDTVGLA